MKIKLYASLINLLKDLISSNTFIQKHKLHPKAFTRNRCLPFKTVIVFLINLLKTSIQTELDNFFKIINDSKFPERVVTSSAFTQARQKLSHTAFIELNKTQINYFYENMNYHKWHGFRLSAIDGSTLLLPKNPDTIKEFGKYSHSSKNTPVVMARVSQCFDVLNQLTIDTAISPLCLGELDLAIEHIRKANSQDLFLFDRGYNAFWLLKVMLEQQVNFCMRANIRNWKAARTLLASGQQEGIFTLYSTDTSKNKLAALNISAESISVRFLAIDLPGGGKEVLMTSLLDLEKYPYSIFADLYSKRWIVEESFKRLKARMEMENFTGKSPETIKQDYYARVFTSNLAMILSFPVSVKIKKKKYFYKINATKALALLKDNVILLFFKDIVDIIITTMQNLFIKDLISIRPNRSFPRILKHNKRYSMAYKTLT